jgi:parvulin-like peptidyl-prolyl isomerase
MTIGGVLAEVNGVPIFAARVMRELEPVLSARAKELEPRPFELEASNLITRQINEFVSEELEYASAQRSLDTDDKKLADLLTTDFRQKKITEAGGSLEQAKRLATEQGNNFEEQINQRNRLFLIQIYYQKKVFPRVQITTSDMREYYAQNVDKLFTEKSEATFRLIRVDPNRVGGKEKALERIKTLRDRANSEDFADLAKTANDDSTLSRSGGKVGPIARNTLALEKVEDAVFRLEPGQVSEIIEDRGGFYIAKLETKKTGSVKPFDDPAVQDRVRRELNSLQVAQMRQQIRADLEKNAIVRRDPRMLQTALDMATQRYPMWRARS